MIVLLKKLYNRVNYYFFLSAFEKDLLKAKSSNGQSIQLLGHTFKYHHGRAFYDTYKELFEDGIFSFKSDQEKPFIIDCGANMGLSILNFASQYPNAKILAFEPDKTVLPTLKENIKSFNLDQVVLIEKAVWFCETSLNFYTDKGMGGRVNIKFNKSDVEVIETVRLKDFIDKPVAMLKMDIEGAEYTVLMDCKEKLHLVDNIFIEYHSFYNEEQHLEDILQILKGKGFRYHLKESFSRKMPFTDKRLLCEQYDMAINIFAYK